MSEKKLYCCLLMLCRNFNLRPGIKKIEETAELRYALSVFVTVGGQKRAR